MNINEQHDGTWQVSKCVLKHSGHMVGDDVYNNYPRNKKLTEEDEEYLERMRKAGAAPMIWWSQIINAESEVDNVIPAMD